LFGQDIGLKTNFVYDRALNPDTFQCTNAPTGTVAPGLPPFLGGGEDCRLDRNMRVLSLDPADFPVALNHGVPFLETHDQHCRALFAQPGPSGELMCCGMPVKPGRSWCEPHCDLYFQPYQPPRSHHGKAR